MSYSSNSVIHPDSLPSQIPDSPIQEEPHTTDIGPPEYKDALKEDPKRKYSLYVHNGEGLESSAAVTQTGRIEISLDVKIPEMPPLASDHAVEVDEYAVDQSSFATAPPLNVVIMIVGSRGDVQPFLALGKKLQSYGHRVRLATHGTFDAFVRDQGLEYFSIGGDPHDLMSYMVRNPGLMPGIESLTNGDIPKKRKMLGEILQGCWRACYEPDETTGRTFAANAIISNPPAFAHVHCAEALGIPLQLSFTMPWCATTSFPHPLVNIQQTNTEKNLTNYLSYALADIMQWQGLGDVINRFRRKTLGLAELSIRSGASITDRLKIPWTYCFSPSLIPKPEDWTNHIDVVGFYFLDSSQTYQPPADLAAFLAGGDPPVYIGFGSVVVEDPEAMTRIIFEAIRLSGVRAIVSAGWGGLGGTSIPSNIFILPAKPGVPHDWLFTKVSAVCHHGGAGTTAIGLYLGRPTIVVPFFGDQPFWGTMIHTAGAGPPPIEHKKLTAQNLAVGIKFCLTKQAKESAELLGQKIKAENGTQNGVDSFHAHLPLLNMRCDLDSSRAAVWWSPQYFLKLSTFAAQVLSDAGLLGIETLQSHRPREYDARALSSDPVTGSVGALFWTMSECTTGLAQILVQPKKGAIHAGSALPMGVSKALWSIQEGLHNTPKLFGSEVRKQGEITDWKSGFVEGGKAFGYGLYDGVSSLVIEPYQGAKKEGLVGGMKGFGRSMINVHVQPAAAGLAIATHPVRGMWRSSQKRWAKTRKQDLLIKATRKIEGVEAFEKSTPAERKAIIESFDASMKTIDSRRDTIKKEVSEKLWKKGDEASLSKETSRTSTSSTSTTRSIASTGSIVNSAPLIPLSAATTSNVLRSPPPLPPRRSAPVTLSPSSALQSYSSDEEGSELAHSFDEEAFQRDLALAIELSHAENYAHPLPLTTTAVDLTVKDTA